MLDMLEAENISEGAKAFLTVSIKWVKHSKGALYCDITKSKIFFSIFVDTGIINFSSVKRAFWGFFELQHNQWF